MEGYDNHGMLRSTADIYVESAKKNNYFDMHSLNKCTVIDTTGVEPIIQVKPNVYDPYENRNIKNPTSNFNTWCHLLKASLGTGILAMPSAFNDSGYLVGIWGTIFIGILCTYSIHLLINASHRLCIKKRVPILSYPDTAAAAFEEGPRVTRKFAPAIRMMTIIFLATYQIGSSCVYVVFIASNLKSVGDYYFESDVDTRMYMIYLVVPLIAICCIRNLKFLAPFSTIATCLTIISLSLIAYYISQDMPSFVNRVPVGTAQGISSSFGTVLFAMEAIGIILPLQNVMSEPKDFTKPFGVLNVAMVIITILYASVGLLGYLKYGDATTDSITFDMPQNEPITQIINISLSLSIYINYALSNFVSFDIIWNEIKPKLLNIKRKIYVEYALRISIVLVTVCFANLLPSLKLLISIVGSFCLSSVGIVFPVIIYFLAYADIYQTMGYVAYSIFCIQNSLIITVGLYAAVVGVTSSMNDIINQYSSIISK